jgi:hypothetical protein
MAKVNTVSTIMYDWQDGQVMKASDYKRERNTIIAAINQTDDEIKQTNTDYLLITHLMVVF